MGGILKTGRLHTHDEIASAFNSAGQFAHIGSSQCDAFLDRLYGDATYRRSLLSASRQVDMSVLFPEELIIAHRTGRCPQLFIPYGTMLLYRLECGSFCALCGAIEREDFMWTTSMSGNRFDRFISGSALILVGEYSWGGTSALCSHCRTLIGRWSRRRRIDFRQRQECVAALSWLLEQPSYEKRLRQYSANWQTLRFDPRGDLTAKAIA